MSQSGSQRQANPCCGVKLKVAVVVIAVVDIIYGILFLTSGLLLFRSNETPIIFKARLEMINLLARPGAKIIFGFILLGSAKAHLKWGGIPSVIGCVLWLLAQIGLFAVSILRLLMYLKNSDDFMIRKSGTTMIESFAIFSSIFPFCSFGVLWYEIVAVFFFIIKLIQDSRMIRATAIALEVAQTGADKNAMYNMSQTPNTKSKEKASKSKAMSSSGLSSREASNSKSDISLSRGGTGSGGKNRNPRQSK
ncbi:unnamed protein product, partial [Allacma fusca]